MVEREVIDILLKNGYEYYMIRENVVSEDAILVHPDTIKALQNNTKNTKYVFIIKHTYANEWSDHCNIRKYKKLAKKYYKYIGW